MPSINNLSYTDTFKTWFDRTNSVISALNGVTVYNVLAGDGIGVTSANNIFTISHGSSVATGVTFNGNVKFNGSVSFASSPSLTSLRVSVTPKTSGLTSGNVVRITQTGLTLAKADNSTNAEVLGMIVGEDASSNIIALNGIVDNSTFANTISNALKISGATLIPGQMYFLDSVAAGGITVNEPTAYQYMSKPVILGICGSVGSLVPYRGSAVGLTAATGVTYTNKIRVSVTTNPTLAGQVSGSTIKVGDFIVYTPDLLDGENTLKTISGNYLLLKYVGTLNNSTYVNCAVIDPSGGGVESVFSTNPNTLLGLISNIVLNDGTTLTVDIILPGSQFDCAISDLDSNLYWDTSHTSQLVLGGVTAGLSPITAFTSNQNPVAVDFIKTSSTRATIILRTPTIVPNNVGVQTLTVTSNAVIGGIPNVETKINELDSKVALIAETLGLDFP